VPVVWLAAGTAIVGEGAHAPAARWAMALGSHGFYFRLASATLENAVSYPISTLGPSALELGAGAAGIAALLAVAALPLRFAREELRGAALLWLFGWLPVSYILMPLQMVFVADRYLLIPSMGVALAIAALCVRISRPSLQVGVVALITGLLAVRSVGARESWSSAERLWARAVKSNPSDGEAWSMYAEALADGGRLDLAAEAVDEGLERARHPRLMLRRALLRLRAGDAAGGRAAMREAATSGEARAMSNLALLLAEDGHLDEALDWARRGAQVMAMYAPAQRALGRVALRAKRTEEALVAFERAFALDPTACTNRLNLALAELELQRVDDARLHAEPCANDAELGAQSRAMLAEIARRHSGR
jgi:Flp pilus assembly protein TadD